MNDKWYESKWFKEYSELLNNNRNTHGPTHQWFVFIEQDKIVWKYCPL